MGPPTVLAASVERQALVPMAAGYLILMTALALGLRSLYRPRATQAEPGQSPGPSPAGSRQRDGWAALARHAAGTVVAGYLLLIAVVIAYYYAVARVGPGFVEGAITGSALLIALAVPVFAAASWLAERLRQRGPAHQQPVPAEPPAHQEAGRAAHPLIGYLAWAVLFGAVFAWEGLALAGVTGVPTFSDVIRLIMRYPVGRWALFALWLWIGWLSFVRSRRFPPRGQDAERAGSRRAGGGGGRP
jgi:Family of unknown function (DUF6256)/Family of unknown function (DUF6186)